jgi:hypothetical protein
LKVLSFFLAVEQKVRKPSRAGVFGQEEQERFTELKCMGLLTNQLMNGIQELKKDRTTLLVLETFGCLNENEYDDELSRRGIRRRDGGGGNKSNKAIQHRLTHPLLWLNLCPKENHSFSIRTANPRNVR